MRVRKLGILAALAAAGAFVACTLNPQPLPPDDERSTFSPGDAGSNADGGTFNGDPTTPPTSDAGAPVPHGEGGADGSDGGDAGSDGGDGGIGDASDAG